MINYKDEAINYLVKREEKYIDFIKNKISKNKNVCIFPMGQAATGIYDKLKCQGINADFFCDNNTEKIGKQYKGIPCISLEELRKIKDNTIVLIESMYYKEIYSQLLSLDFNNLEILLSSKFEADHYFENNDTIKCRKKIIELMDILEDEESKRVACRIIESWVLKDYEYGFFDDIYLSNQYFTKEIVQLSEQEIFVDVGSFTGDTIEQFIHKTEGRFEKILAFELNKSIYRELKNNVKKHEKQISDKIILYNVGLSNEEKIIAYSDEGSGSNINENGEFSGKVIDLDSILNGDKVTFIKMDIEGAELDALHGARKTIEIHKPKLAICIYHSAEDLWRIPLYIKQLVPDYKIYIRHHTVIQYETVCYAIPK